MFPFRVLQRFCGDQVHASMSIGAVRVYAHTLQRTRRGVDGERKGSQPHQAVKLLPLSVLSSSMSGMRGCEELAVAQDSIMRGSARGVAKKARFPSLLGASISWCRFSVRGESWASVHACPIFVVIQRGDQQGGSDYYCGYLR